MHRIVMPFLGDFIESFTMHDLESASGCEMHNAEQVTTAIELVFSHLIVPVASLGRPVIIPCVPGNHDRVGRERTYQTPGLVNLTHIIYCTLEMLCRARGFSNVEFMITEELSLMVPYRGIVTLYEHGDIARSNGYNDLQSLLMKRQEQQKQLATLARFAHFHQSAIYDGGRILVNGTMIHSDSYAKSLGFSQSPCQIMSLIDCLSKSVNMIIPVKL